MYYRIFDKDCTSPIQPSPDSHAVASPPLHNQTSWLLFFIMTQISDMVKGVVEGEEVCITLGGDHSIALGKSCDDNVM